MRLVISQPAQARIEGEPLPFRFVRTQLVERDAGVHLTLVQEHIRAVHLQVMGKAAQPDLQGLWIGFKQGHGVFDEARAVERPVIFTVEHPERPDLRVRGVNRTQLAQLRVVDDKGRVRTPVFGDALAHGFVAGVFGDEHLADGRGVEAVESLERALEQIEPTATGHHQRDFAAFTEKHGCPRWFRVGRYRPRARRRRCHGPGLSR